MCYVVPTPRRYCWLKSSSQVCIIPPEGFVPEEGGQGSATFGTRCAARDWAVSARCLFLHALNSFTRGPTILVCLLQCEGILSEVPYNHQGSCSGRGGALILTWGAGGVPDIADVLVEHAARL